MSPSRRPSSRLRSRALLASAGLGVLVGLPLAASPAYAAAPVGWPEADPISLMSVLVIFVFAPVGLALLIMVFALAPSLARGEGLGGSPEESEEWFGGRRDAEGALEAADDAAPKEITGGASGRF